MVNKGHQEFLGATGSAPKPAVSIRLAPRRPERRPGPRWISGVPPKGMALCLWLSASAAAVVTRGMAVMIGSDGSENALAGCRRPARSIRVGASNETQTARILSTSRLISLSTKGTRRPSYHSVVGRGSVLN